MSNIEREEAMDVAFERVGKVDSPLLVIGLGGTGIDMLREIKNTFARRYKLATAVDGTTMNRPARTAYLAIDSDQSERTGFNADEFVHIKVEGMDTILKNRNSLATYETAWLDPKFNAMKPGPGAGSIRQASRFMLSRSYTSVYQKISDALNSILITDVTSSVPGRLEVVICAGISGGTGSGTFLDVPQIVRHIIGKNYPHFPPNVTGYLVLPDATFALSPSIAANVHPDFQANAYAALKELDFWQRLEEHKTHYAIQYNTTEHGTVGWQRPPYDACVLMSASDVKGKKLENPRKVLFGTVAENLLHYLAQEVVHQDGDGRPQYSYISHENNLVRLLNNARLTFTTPLHHGYRAVGAYTMAIPKVKMFNYEASILFSTFMPELSVIDGQLVINDIALQHNSLPETVTTVLPKMKPMMESLIKEMLPKFTLVDPGDSAAIVGMQEGKAPHEKLDETNWIKPKVYPLANSNCRKYLEQAWANFGEWAVSIMADPKQGPYSLALYLTDKSERGFMAALEGQLDMCRKRQKASQTEKINGYNTCVATLANFRRPPLLGRRTAIAAYLDALRKYYENAIKECFFENQVIALSLLRDRINMFVNMALDPLNKDLLRLRKEFDDARSARDAGFDLISMSTLQQRIDTVFQAHNDQGQITNSFLTALGKQVLETRESTDYKVAYVTFTYHEFVGQQGHYSLLHDILEECFGNVFDGSLDQLLRQEAHNDDERLRANLAGKINQLKTAATPLFSDLNTLSEPNIDFTYMSVPSNSQALKDFIETYNNDERFTPKESDINDRIYCLLTWDGLPLSRYNAMSACEAAYYHRVFVEDTSAGLHLVRTRTPGTHTVTNDWALLPSPSPFYFTGSDAPNPAAASDFERICKLVEEAEKCGMLTVDDSDQHPSYTVKLFYTDNVNGILYSNEALEREIAGIKAATINTATGAAITNADRLVSLEAMMTRAASRRLQGSCPVSVMRTYCGFGTSDLLDPFAAHVQANPTLQATAKVNFAKLSRAFCAALLAADPALAEKMEIQLSVFQKYQQAKSEMEKLDRVWDVRAEYATTLCDMMMHDVIFTMGTSVGYRDAGKAKQWLFSVESPLLADDLKKEDCLLLQACGYLADRPEDQVRKYLEHKLALAKSQFEDGMKDDSLTAEDYQDLMENAETMQEMVAESLASKEAAKTVYGANVNLIDKQVALLNTMRTHLSKNIRAFKNAIKHL